ncbi:MAG TPA: hypothetical protein VF519_17285 [Mycobacteriales bacterium]|jgi:hypothetical protein
MEWLAEIERRSARADVPPGDAPWVPPILENVPREVLATLHYVVVDDVDDAEGDVVLTVEPWPVLDAIGRVRHAMDQARERYVPVVKWARLLERRRIPAAVARAPRIGDAFAMRLPRSGDVTRPVGPVVDVTADAREAARASFYGAVAAPMTEEVAERVRDDEDAPHLTVDVPEEWR